ncbi:MAG: DUF5131 family protein [Acidobacteriia bacterium]|nr:DUF5131 family protein [Terriglobia bacterium]
MASKIDWTDETVNFATGCKGPTGTPCHFCYARRMAKRLGGIKGSVYARTKAACGDEFAPAFHNDVYEREKERLTTYRHGGMHAGYTVRPRRVFLSSMGDICFEGTAPEMPYLEENWTVTSKEVQNRTAKWCERVGAAGHTCLILTKRPDLLDLNVRWPSNVHLGVSVTSNEDAGRISELLDRVRVMREQGYPSVLGGHRGPSVLWASVEPLLDDLDPESLRGLGWVVVGLQTGPGAPQAWEEKRKKLEDAVVKIVEWCRGNGIPCFVKDSIAKSVRCQGGEWPREYPKKAGPA